MSLKTAVFGSKLRSPPGFSLSLISSILVGLVPIYYFMLDIFQIPLAPDMLLLVEVLILFISLIAELTSS